MIRVALVGSLLTAIVSAQSDQAITQESIQPLVAEAVKIGAGNADKVISAFDKAVKRQFGDVDYDAITFRHGTDVFIGAAMSPLFQFRSELRSAIRKMEPTEGLKLADHMSIVISPDKVTAPDIAKVVVQRDGTVVEPLSNTLAPQTFTNRLGASFTMHAGELKYPMSAFATGATVTITLIPETGDNKVVKLESKRLAKIR